MTTRPEDAQLKLITRSVKRVETINYRKVQGKHIRSTQPNQLQNTIRQNSQIMEILE